MEGGRYEAEPVSLVYDDNNYYMVCYSPKYGHTVTFRVDRMEKVRTEDEIISEEAMKQRDDPTETVAQAFRMFFGEQREVKLRFHDRLIGLMYDKFGEDLKITRVDGQHCEAEVTVQISPPFWSWLFMLSGDMRLTGPEDLVERYAALIKNAASEYNK